MFRCNHHHQGEHCMGLLKLQCILIGCFNIITLASPYSALPDDGDYTETCWSSLTFRHRASCILGQAFHYSPENAFYIFNQQIYFFI